MFPFRIGVGAVALLGLSAVLADARRTATRRQDSRDAVARIQREMEFANPDRDARLEYQQWADSPMVDR
jgi:hypothetical protein